MMTSCSVSYAIAQSAPAGWRVESISCAGDLDGGSTFDAATGQATIDLDPGEALVCTFENVRDEDAVRIATQRAIYNFMARRADRIVSAAPDLSDRFAQRDTTQRGSFSADMDGSGRSQMALSMSLAGMRNAAAAETPEIAGVTNYERPFMEGWDIWLATEWSRVEDNRGGDDATSDFSIAQLGIDYQLSDNLIVGLMAQYDWMDETSDEINVTAGAVAGATVEGEGWMAGPYAVWRLHDQLVLDAMALYGSSDNTVNPLGLYEDDFETDRLMVRANLTGEYQNGAWRVRPQASLTHFEETQDSYVDSLNITIPEQTVRIGRLTAGPEVAWRHTTRDGGFIELNTNLQAVWDYDSAGQISEAGLLVATEDNVRADARFGASTRFSNGASIRFETGFAGLGMGKFEATTARFEIRIPFGAGGRTGGSSMGGAFAGTSSMSQPSHFGCDDRTMRGFANAAGMGQSCDTAGFGTFGR
jgi:outer membrane autotransporter protein